MRPDRSAATTEAASAWSPFRHVAFTPVAVVVGHGRRAAAWPLAAGAQQRPSGRLASRPLLYRSHSARREAGDLPVQFPVKVEMVVNLDTAKDHPGCADRRGGAVAGGIVDDDQLESRAILRLHVRDRPWQAAPTIM